MWCCSRMLHLNVAFLKNAAASSTAPSLLIQQSCSQFWRVTQNIMYKSIHTCPCSPGQSKSVNCNWVQWWCSAALSEDKLLQSLWRFWNESLAAIGSYEASQFQCWPTMAVSLHSQRVIHTTTIFYWVVAEPLACTLMELHWPGDHIHSHPVCCTLYRFHALYVAVHLQMPLCFCK